MFLIPILHQTTTLFHPLSRSKGCFSFQFYIKPQHWRIRMFWKIGCFSFQFYIKPQQFGVPVLTVAGCFSFQFYIKPQHKFGRNAILPVVSHSNSTSNHNPLCNVCSSLLVVSHSNSTSNHNYRRQAHCKWLLFLIPILHQTTTSRMAVIHILHVTHMTPMHKTSCRTPGKLVGCNFVFQRAIYQKNSSC